MSKARRGPVRSYTVFENRVDSLDSGLVFEVWETCLPVDQAGGCTAELYCNCRRESVGALKACIEAFATLHEALQACEDRNEPLLAVAMKSGRVPDQRPRAADLTGLSPCFAAASPPGDLPGEDVPF